MNIINLNLKDLKPYEKNLNEKIYNYGFDDDICVIENKYIITKTGKVYTIYNSKIGIKEQKLRKHTNGYLRATIFGKDYYVHRLVALCFIENPNNYNEISHEDNNKENNNVSNLKWCSRKYNCKKVFDDNIRTKEEMIKIAKLPKIKARVLTDDQVKEIRKSNLSDSKLAKLYNVSRGTIWQCRNNITYKEN